MSHRDPFVRMRRGTRPGEPRPSPDPDEKVTIACRCGAVVTVSWRRRTALRCFGCDRAFEPPPHVVASPLVWRPYAATPLEPPASGGRSRRQLALAVAAFLTLGPLLALGFWLAVQAASP